MGVILEKKKKSLKVVVGSLGFGFEFGFEFELLGSGDGWCYWVAL